MKLSELERKLDSVLKDCQIEFDNQGQIVIYTGLTVDEETGEIREMKEKKMKKYKLYGLKGLEFEDFNGKICQIQESSLANFSCIWLGVDGNRMHLNQEQVKELLPLLEHFVKTGNLP